jgi:hypothetical protein
LLSQPVAHPGDQIDRSGSVFGDVCSVESPAHSCDVEATSAQKRYRRRTSVRQKVAAS